MHIDFASSFVDPRTHAPLRLDATRMVGGEVIAGALVSPSAEYPIIDGIPRFVDPGARDYAGSFGYQWTRWPRAQFERENRGGAMEGYTRGMWETITGRGDDVAGKLLVDIGCGPGRFIDVARMNGARVIGLDYSRAVEAAARNFAGDPGVCICQADALHLPLRDEAVDGAFSIGVLHHTPEPSRGVEEAARVVAPGGWLAIAVYGKGGYYDDRVVNAWRRLFGRLWNRCGHYPPLAYTYFTVYLERALRRVPLASRPLHALLPSKSLPDLTWSLVDTFDSVTPQFQSAHECREVFAWLRACGLAEIEPTGWGATSFRGVKPDAAPVAAMTAVASATAGPARARAASALSSSAVSGERSPR